MVVLTNLYDEVKEVLKKDENNRFFAESGELLRNKLYEAVLSLDSGLIRLLLSNDITKKKFFKEIDGFLIFDSASFGWIINNKEFLPDSYTRFKNKIGLTDSNSQFISNNGNVVLSFPYKDCILEGGQTKEDQKRGEVFYNELLAPDDIDKLLAPKVFTNAKRYTKDDEEKITKFNDTDNLLIKGNNLLVISSLLERFEGRVKLIYIDPPYNTGNDSFKYNDKFSRSSWLTFMKNRLSIAKKLLSSDGSIFINIDENQSHYLKVLMDEIWGENNFRNEIIWSYSSGGKSMSYFAKKHDTIFWYSRGEKWIFNGDDIAETRGNKKKNNMKKNIDENGKIYYSIKSNGKIYKYYEDDKVVPVDVWDMSHLQQQDPERTGFNTQKPENLIERIIKVASNEKDIILDFHVGSGTTCAVAHKLCRQYIGVEQMDYINNLTIPRLKKVLYGESVGISKITGWQGGGSFVYCELKENNQQFMNKILSSNNDKELSCLLQQIISTGFISYKINVNDINENENEFENLTIEDKKKFLTELLDKNMLYVNYCDIADEDFSVSEDEKAFSKSFYEVK